MSHPSDLAVEFIAFALLFVVAFGCVSLWMWRTRRGGRLLLLAWAFLIASLVPGWFLTKAAEALDVQVNEGEVNSRLATIAMQQGRRPEKLRQELQRRGELETIQIQIRDQKTLEKIIDQANVTDEQVSDSKTQSKGAKKTPKGKKPAQTQVDEPPSTNDE